MRIVPAAMPVRSATSLMARPLKLVTIPSTSCSMFRVSSSWTTGAAARRDRIPDAPAPVPGAMTPILLTGASGYVGSHLLAELRSRGQRVRALVRDPGSADLPARRRAAQGRRRQGHRPARGARRRAHRLLPDPLDERPRRLRRPRPRGRRELRRGRGRGRRRARRLPRRARADRARGVGAPALAPRGRRAAGPARAARLRPRRDGDRARAAPRSRCCATSSAGCR